VLTISWCIYFSLVTILVPSDDKKRLGGHGPWYSTHFWCPYWLGGILNRHCKCFHHHLVLDHLLKTSSNRRLVVLAFFPFVYYFFGLQVPLLFSHHYSFKALFVILSFMSTCLRQPTCMASFCASSFLCFAFFLRFLLHVISLPCPMTCISSTLPMSSPSFLIILLLNWLLWGCPFNPTNVHRFSKLGGQTVNLLEVQKN